MRFLRAIKNFINLVFAAAFTLALCFCVKAANISKLSSFSGQRVFYLDSVSSQALIKTRLTVFDVFRVKGESVCFTLTEERSGKEREADFVRSLIEEYGGKLLFTEEACGTVSYYAHVPAWGKGVAINGAEINLHIALCAEESRCAVGTPIIFGGF